MYSAQQHNRLFEILEKFKVSSDYPKIDPIHFEHFKLRMSANYEAIVDLLNQLYGRLDTTDNLIEEVIKIMLTQFADRATDLKELDLAREKNPNWLLSEQWMGMMLYVDHFAGDLKGFKKKIPYLEELGINWVHLMPLLQSPEGENDGGYAVTDYRKVDRKYGSMSDIRSIAKSFRKKNMLMALDYVMNHTADDHQWAIKAKAGDAKYQDYYFMFSDRNIPDQFEQTMPEVFPNAAPGNFTFNEATGKWVMTQFHSYQWDLNYYNPQVLLEMLDTAFFLANQGIDILRLDAVPFIWKKLGTVCRNEYEAHVILRIFKACFQVVSPGVVFIAEAIVRPHEIMGYFGKDKYYGRECDIAYNATFMALSWEALASGDTTLLKKVTSKSPTKPFGTTWINYLRSHDDIGLGFDDEDIYELGIDANSHRKFILDYYTGNFPHSMASGAPFAYNPKTGDARISGTLAALTGLEKARQLNDQTEIDFAVKRILMLQSVVLSLGGLPMIYSGGEIGLGNDYSFEQDQDKAYDNRWMHRPSMDWDKAELRKKEGAVERQVFTGLQKLIQLRKKTPAFGDLNNTSLEFTENKHVYSFLRWLTEGRNVLVMVNFFNGTQFVKRDILQRLGMDHSRIIDLITNKPPNQYHDLIEFGPYQAYWLQEV